MNRARQNRLNLGLTVSQVAELTDVSRQAIARVEEGKSIHPASLKALGDFFEVPASSLLMPAIDLEAAA